MNWMESIAISITSILNQKLRSSLTLLGVVIGVITIIATMSIIKGLKNMMEEEMSGLSAGVFQVQKWDVQIGDDHNRHRRKARPNIGPEEVRALKENVPLARVIAPEIWKWNAVIKYQNNATNPNCTVAGGVPGFVINNGIEIENGRELTEQDVQFARHVTVLGSSAAQKIFPFRDPVGEYVFVNGKRARVVGVVMERGSMFGGGSYGNFALVPLTTFINWWGSERSWNVTVRVANPEKIKEAIDQATVAMRVVRGLRPGDENNFGIWHSDQLIQSFNEITKWIRVAAFGIASISLLVAGIGIMNIMLVVVTERTREIGIRMALGAKRSSILGQFLVEAVILSEIGAVIGVIIGVVAALLLGKAANLPIAVPLWSILVGILFCSAIGVIFGTWPAWKASRLNPIEALRYE
ncbi:MAG: ABC transporter permease [Candidatus Electryonea clarkiae]|nr:ABC transporter permease [Candidatus Electryonea clarkiae]MDP8287368.1 ABC transporter permease [Candidatus Electryonea clarkiae]